MSGAGAAPSEYINEKSGTMKTTVLKKSAGQLTRWSGGTTDQILLYPPQSRLAARDFLWRLSVAEVDDEASDFSDFTGYERILGLREGYMALDFGGHGSAVLSPGDTVRFDGGWRTRSRGRGKDCNLILRRGIKGCMEPLTLSESMRWRRSGQYVTEKGGCRWLLYLNSGKLTAGTEENLLTAEAGDCLVIESGGEAGVGLTLTGTAALFEIGVAW